MLLRPRSAKKRPGSWPVTIRYESSVINRSIRFSQNPSVDLGRPHDSSPLIALHCNRCGRKSQDLTPALPKRVGPATTENASAQPFFVCADCFPVSNGQAGRYCSRCGNETPSTNLTAGRCDWCRSADDIPFEEPDDDDWWEEKMGRASGSLETQNLNRPAPGTG